MGEKKTDTGGKPGGKKDSAGGWRKVTLAVLLLLLLFLLIYFVSTSSGPAGGGRGDGADTSAAKTVPADTGIAGGADTSVSDTADADTAFADVPAVIPPGVNADSLARARRARADSLARVRASADSVFRLDSIRVADSLAFADSVARVDSLVRADSVSRVAAAVARRDSVARADSMRVADSLSRIVDPCKRDTLAPWVTPDPSGGRHRKAVAVQLLPNKAKVVIEWSLGSAGNWKVYDGKPISIDKNSTLYYRASDDCGRKMAVRSKRYDFDMSGKPLPCPPDMELVSAGGREFCVDVYEWPNKRMAAPQAFVSLYQAMDSCFSARKRLCTSDEWTSACAGPDNWAYLYGPAYEGNVCAARDSMAFRSGSRPECRGYYAVFDMSGNLAEWTSTTAPQDRSFNNVMGGFWQSGSQTKCADARYSYFPQNRHNPVGFRCCRDAEAQKGSGR